MKRFLYLMLATVCLSLSFSSCDTIKKFLATDLEEEDFIIGQLYADEYVEEAPYSPAHRNRTPNHSASTPTGKCPVEVTDKDNKSLYAAIDSWYGTPYLYGGCSKEGVDCSCFVGHIFDEVYGIKLHRVANDITQDVSFIPRSQLREGDILFFTNSNGKISHVGIYLKDDLFVHSSTSRGVMVSQLSSTYWDSHFYKAGRHNKVQTKWK